MNVKLPKIKKIKIIPIYVGDKVKINLKMIKEQPDYPKGLLPNYVEWIESNNKKTFTVTKNNYGVCNLKDSEEDVVWTFWEGHLIKKEIKI